MKSILIERSLFFFHNSFYIMGSVILILLGYFISRITANNDIYMQLLAVDGIINSFDFSGVGGHPIGIALIGTFIRLIGADPLLVLFYLQPVFCAFCFIILLKLLKKVLPNNYAFFISLNAMLSLVLIKAMNQVSAEIISLAAVLYFLLYVWDVIIIKEKENNTHFIILVLLSWITILLRNASIFIILGVLVFIFQQKIYKTLKFSLLSLLLLFPGILKSMISVDNNSSLENILSIKAPMIFYDQIIKHIKNLVEIVIPYNLHLNKFPEIKLVIGLSCVVFCLVNFFYNNIHVNKISRKNIMADFFLTVGLSYFFFLSLASVYLGDTSIYSTDWGNIYRVSGFGILFLLCAFWIYIKNLKNLKRSFVFYVLLLLCFGKLSYGLRYEILASNTRLFFSDYRTIGNSVKNYMIGTEDNEKLLIYTFGSHQGKNLYYILKYYNFLNPLTFKIDNLTEFNHTDNAVKLCAYSDLETFSKAKYEAQSIDNFRAIYLLHLKQPS